MEQFVRWSCHFSHILDIIFPQHRGSWQVLFELILAANYLDIKSLLDLTCAKVASMIKGKNTEDMLASWGFIMQIAMDLAAGIESKTIMFFFTSFKNHR